MNANSKVTDIKQCTYSFVEKSKELFETIKEFNNKVKEIYTTLYQKYKNSGTPDNISSFSNSSSISSISIFTKNNYYYELCIHEKKMLSFVENQIRYYKNLIELIKKYERDNDILQLNEFYTNLASNFAANNHINIKDFGTGGLKTIKLKKPIQNNILDNNLFKSNVSKFNLSNDNHLPILKKNNLNSSLSQDKRKSNLRTSFKQNICKNINLKVKSCINNKIIKEPNKIDNNKLNLNEGTSSRKDSKNMKNPSINPTPRKKSNFTNKDKEKEQNNDNSNSNSKEELSENNVADSMTNKGSPSKNKNDNQISPIQLHLRGSMSTDLMSRKFSMVNDSIVSNSKMNNHNNIVNTNSVNLNENNDKKAETNQKPPLYRFSSINNFHNVLKNSPLKKASINNDFIPTSTKKKILNDPVNNRSKIIDTGKVKAIDTSGMKVNDSNFIRDKQKDLVKKDKTDLNKYDFFM